MKITSKLQALTSCVLVLLTVVGMTITMTNTNKGLLEAYGMQNLKFFTVDSNLFLGLVCLADLAAAALKTGGRYDRLRKLLDQLIYMATVAVSLTFAVVVLFFGPTLGYENLFRGGNLFFHLINPVVAILSFCIFQRGRRIQLHETLYTLIPSVLYGIYYVVVLLVYGVHFPETDWYGFASGGLTGSVITAASILFLTWVIALILRVASGRSMRGQGRGAFQSMM